MKKYKVADFFCGGGGFSEGFKLAGFEVVFAVDRWQPAVTTHHANHPNANTYLGDVIQISNLPDDEFHQLIPDTEVIIGSPPCTSFSNSNRSGKADKSLGIQLIEAYLRIIARKKMKKDSILKHWVLENVPNVVSYIKDEYTYEELGIDSEGKLKVKYPSSKVYNSKYFGVASNRKRYFCGDFPEPEQTIVNDEDTRTVNDVLKFLKPPKNNLEETIQDPNYNDFDLVSKDITDHHYVMEVADFEWKKAKRLKQDKGYMGKMSFPENLDKPSRTIMATMSSCARESIIYPYIPEENRYRVPTVREIGCIMSYPLDYRFYGKSKSIKYKLVGNSVPPKMSFAIAKSIAEYNLCEVPTTYIPIKFNDKALDDFMNLNLDIFHLNIEKPKKITAKFKYHIPYLIRNVFRVELTNYNSDFENSSFKWEVEIHRSQGPRAKVYRPKIVLEMFNIEHQKVMQSFIESFKYKLTDATRLQENHCKTEKERKINNDIGPYELLNLIREFIDNNIVEEDFNKNIFIDNELTGLPYVIAVGFYVLNELKIIYINR
ncbi:DNA cytosine methyltransferase [Sulfurimonas sp. HSL3-7]|uniref:DNA cytosine methyltransferase n=1 Tax=Sulfonitrofixus jiaomeiensis TaxID=3131938 RepID=UPI0031F8917B